MKTSSWQTIGAARGRIGISVGSPRGQPAGYRLYRALAPTRDMLQLPRDQYEPRFKAILAKLDAKKVWDDLHRLANPDAKEGDRYEVEPILLCFEKPPFNDRNWCHRRMVADWFKEQLGIDVPELGYEPQPSLI